jgi:hypothetical protein
MSCLMHLLFIKTTLSRHCHGHQFLLNRTTLKRDGRNQLPKLKNDNVHLRCSPLLYVSYPSRVTYLTRVALVATGRFFVQILKMVAVAYAIYLTVSQKLEQHRPQRSVRPDFDTILVDSCDMRRAWTGIITLDSGRAGHSSGTETNLGSSEMGPKDDTFESRKSRSSPHHRRC